ncbi:MAG: hypothetical protein LBE82_03585, partial [Chitinophagaceae bacterium]|nr:hypothetical protein [Chitinophagaceae bacterium]
INEIHQFEEAPLGETLFEAVFPGQEIKTEEAFRAKIKENYDDAYKERSRTHLNDQLYHYLLEHTEVELPKDFIMRWMQAGSEEKKSTEEIEKKYLTYTGLLKWQIISTKLQRDFRITVTIPEFNAYVIHRLSDMYGGGIPFADNPEWLKDYTEKALKNEKYVNEAYHYISNDKIFSQLENMAQVKEESINENDFFETVRRYKIEHNNSFELGEHNHEHEHNHTHEHEHEHEHNHEH